MDHRASLSALPPANIGRSHIAAPSPFTGKKEDYRRFRQQLRLYLTANQGDFCNAEVMVIFALSYMTQGTTAKWADAYIDKALEADNWGKYSDFLDLPTQDFGDKEEPRKALEQMGWIYQGKGMASEYFQKLEQLVATAGIDINRSPHVLLQMEKGLNVVLIDQLYFLGTPPNNYRDYKQRVIDADDMQKSHEANRGKKTFTLKTKNLDDMEIDKKEIMETCKCFNCNKQVILLKTVLIKKRSRIFKKELYSGL
jgi:hypothetical protein